MSDTSVIPEIDVRVIAKINVNAKTVTLKRLQTDPGQGQFLVRGGDTVTWELQDAFGTSKAFPARVRFDPPASGPPLFTGQGIFKADLQTKTITTTAVNTDAKPTDFINDNTPAVAYRYHFELETSAGVFTELKCLWTTGAITTDEEMGGGEKGPRPTKP
jgi:hypothetical protein